jgi:hypothetical protein
MKLGRNHVLGALDAGRKQETQSQAEKCKKHTTENIKYYCRNHDSVACGDCLVFDHRKCEPGFIRDLAKNITESSDFKNILKEVENLTDFKTEMELSLERNRKENTEFHDKAIHEIQTCRAEINAWLDNVASKIEAEETEIWKENEIMLSKLEDWIKIIHDMIDEVRDEISTDRYIRENLFIRVIECKSKLSEFVTKSVPEIKLNLDIKPFAFEPNQKLFVFTKSENLGKIRVGRGNIDMQTIREGRQKEMTCIDGSSNVVPSNITGNAQNCSYIK